MKDRKPSLGERAAQFLHLVAIPETSSISHHAGRSGLEDVKGEINNTAYQAVEEGSAIGICAGKTVDEDEKPDQYCRADEDTSSSQDQRAWQSSRRVRSVPSWVMQAGQIPIYHANRLSVTPGFPRTGALTVTDQEEKSDTFHITSDGVLINGTCPPEFGATPENLQSRWRAFCEASSAQNGFSVGHVVDDDLFHSLGPDYDSPWLAGREYERGQGQSETNASAIPWSSIKRRAWYIRFRRRLLRSPIVPMLIRLVVLGFSVTALGLAVSIHMMTYDVPAQVKSTASTIMAIVVDTVACVYLLYITYDEYSSKPLGLRSTHAKLRLIFLDLIFIVFNSSNLSLAFETIRSDQCVGGLQPDTDCLVTQSKHLTPVLGRQKALASVLLIVLIAWLLTFSISIAR